MNPTVMVVDDSRATVRMVAEILRSNGYAVVEVYNGSDALAQLRDTKIGLLITDLNMPGMDGIALMKAVHAIPQYRFAPVVMLTTESQLDRKVSGIMAGVTAWCVKPVVAEDLMLTVRRLLPE